MCLQALSLMKEGLQAAGLKAHLIAQPVGFHTQDVGDHPLGYCALPEYPFGELFLRVRRKPFVGNL